MRVLITGGAGFIGKHLAHLLADDHELIALDNLLPQVHADPEVSVRDFPGTVLRGDVADPDAWKQAPSCDVVVHLAAETGTAQSMYEQDRYRRVNVEGTRLAGVWAKAAGASLISMSSRAVYGEGRYECSQHGVGFGGACCDDAVPAASRETDPFRPLSVYGETKAEAETLLSREVASSIPLAIVRPQNVVGPGQDLHNPYTGVLAAFLARLKEGKPITVYGDGSQTRDFVHVRDVAKLLAWLALKHRSVGNPLVLNSGTGERTTLTALAHLAAAGSPRGTTEIEHLPIHRAGDIEHALADLSRLREVGAPMPELSTAEAVKDFIQQSWAKSGAPSETWDQALEELSQKGMASS